MALAAVGVIQLVVALTQGFGVDMGVSTGGQGTGHGSTMAGHLLNESTAWSIALGLVMMLAALRPAFSPGLAVVLTVFAIILVAYVIRDAAAGAVTMVRLLSHLPVLAGALLAMLVWRGAYPTGPDQRPKSDGVSDDADDADEIVLPDHASRGRLLSRGQLRPTDGSAA